MKANPFMPWNWFKQNEADRKNASQATDDSEKASKHMRRKEDHEPKTNLMSQQAAAGMTALPVLRLHQEIEQVFDSMLRSLSGSDKPSLFTSPLFGKMSTQSLSANDDTGARYNARVDVSGDKQNYEICVDVPGMSEDDVTVELTGHQLTIKGSKQESYESNDKEVFRMERSFGTFSRTISLPEDADVEQLSANLDKGELRLTIPRVANSGSETRRIRFGKTKNERQTTLEL